MNDKKVFQTYKNEIIHVDDFVFEGCEFVDCVIVYSGGTSVMQNCHFSGCNWELEGAALRTLRWLKALYEIEGDGTMQQFIMKTFENISGNIIWEDVISTCDEE